MTGKDPATAAAEAAAKELVKVAYGDLLQPAAKDLGAELQQFVRAAMVAGRGFGYLIRETYQPFVLQALANIDPKKKIPPPPPVIGQILEEISCEAVDTPIYEMFQNLLSSSMNADKYDLVHPSFPGIIKSLSPDEARILSFSVDTPIHRLSFPKNDERGPPEHISMFCMEPVKLHSPEAADFYMDNLFKHGLMDWEEGAQIPYELNGWYGTRMSLKLSRTGSRLMSACRVGS